MRRTSRWPHWASVAEIIVRCLWCWLRGTLFNITYIIGVGRGGVIRFFRVGTTILNAFILRLWSGCQG